VTLTPSDFTTDLRRCLYVCFHDKSKLHVSILIKLLSKGNDHLQLIKFLAVRAPEKGSVAGRKFLAPFYYSQRAVFASPLSVFFLF